MLELITKLVFNYLENTVKFIVNKKDLNEHLQLVKRVIPDRPTHPVLANILLTANLASIELTGFDLALGIKSKLVADVIEEGSVCVPAKLLTEIVSKLPDGELTFEAEELQGKLTYSTGSYKISLMSAEEYPELPSLEVEKVSLPSEALLESLKATLFATSNDETKQVLTGLRIELTGDLLAFASTDGHRLAMAESTSEEANYPDINATIPARALRELEQGLRNKKVNVDCYFGEGQAVFEWSDQRITTRLLEGQYPAYRQLLPTTTEKVLTSDRKQLLLALDRLSVLNDPKNQIVQANIKDQVLVLSVDGKDLGSGRESLPVQFTGEDIILAFNTKYLKDSLQNISTSEVQLLLNTATSPVLIKPLGGAKSTHLLMPVQLRN